MNSDIEKSFLYQKLRRDCGLMASKSPYVTYTLSNGSEIYTVSNREITVVSLNRAQNSSSKLDVKLDFDPTAVCVNRNEDLMCLYNSEACHIISINPPASQITFTKVYKLSLLLEKDEIIIQVLFNNISCYQAEVVILTGSRILCYDINDSLVSPVQEYEFIPKKESNSGGAGLLINAAMSQSTVMDPVSFCFASDDTSNSSPESDITLLILTSDVSIYRIYPFLPSTLSVEKKWLTSLFDTTAAQYSSINDVSLRLHLNRTLKFTASLANLSGTIITKSQIPKYYRKGKIIGPLPIEPFFDELYDQNALRIFSLKNGLFCVVLDHAVLCFYYDSRNIVMFEKDSQVPPLDSISVVDTALFDRHFSITSGFVKPFTLNGAVLVTSQPGLLYVDYSSWMTYLDQKNNTGGMKQFEEVWMTGDHLPTTVNVLGKIRLVSSNRITPEKQSFDINATNLTEPVPLASSLNQVWLAWNKEVCLISALSSSDNNNMTIFCVSAQPYNVQENKQGPEEYISPSNGDISQYVSKMKGDNLKSVMKEHENIERGLLKLRQLAAQFPSKVIDPTSYEDLSLVQNFNEICTNSTILLFKEFSAISKNLAKMKAELAQQITTLEILRAKQKSILDKAKLQKDKLCEYEQKQERIHNLVHSLKQTCEKIMRINSEAKDIDLSEQEVGYVNLLNMVRRFVLEKQDDLKTSSATLKESKEHKNDIIGKAKLEYGNSFSKRQLKIMKEKLEARKASIATLKSNLANMRA